MLDTHYIDLKWTVDRLNTRTHRRMTLNEAAPLYKSRDRVPNPV